MKTSEAKFREPQGERPKAVKLAVLPGDGIGPEIVAQAVKVLDVLKRDGAKIEMEYGNIGGIGYDREGDPLPESTLKLSKQANAVLLGAVGGPQYDTLDRPLRPERGLLRIRKELNLFANLRPALLYPELAGASSLKPEVVAGLDIMIVRELTSGLYFGQPRGIEIRKGERVGFNTMFYSESEIRRVAHIAFAIAMKRGKRLCSVEKANVLECSELWREVVAEVAKRYPEVELSTMYVDNAAMQLVRNPKQFDVIVTSNLFGDILSDEASMLSGSIGMLPSASLDEHNKGMYEPIHGSAPDIAGRDIANPLATILSVAMMYRYTFAEAATADRIENAVKQVIAQGYRTSDIWTAGGTKVSCSAMGDAVVAAM
ncbi:MAG: 3-isopropylmalate dehydrogenase [Hydrogenophilales bacterium CG17_big_fil_post_rev_8_21_14_2_50_63_12]|nr:MAG: 3-isopropylmalate dehydrogenase [Hydrogenophilales bacterium CG17_big_fil_post_rev_8_21_14_2_50_63_12]